MSDLRLAIFDCDGTLVDSQRSIVDAMFEALDGHAISLPDEQAVIRVVGLPLERAIAILVPDADGPLCAELAEQYKQSFFRMRQGGAVHEPLFPGVLETIERLEDEGWLLGIATGKAYRGLKATLSTHGILERFVTRQTADVARGKPHPEMILRAMSETGVERQNTVMIGDTTFDMEMAVSAGTRAIGVGWGYHDEDELLEAGATVVVGDGPALLDALINPPG